MDIAKKWQRGKCRVLGIIAVLLLVAGMAHPGCGGEEPTPSPTPTVDPLVSDSARRVLVVHSYDDQFQWTRDQGKGIVEGLRRMGCGGFMRFFPPKVPYVGSKTPPRNPGAPPLCSPSRGLQATDHGRGQPANGPHLEGCGLGGPHPEGCG